VVTLVELLIQAMFFQTQAIPVLKNLQWCWPQVNFSGFSLWNRMSTHFVWYSLEQKSVLRESAKPGESCSSVEDAKDGSPSLTNPCCRLPITWKH